jgi:hypothetical protein
MRRKVCLVKDHHELPEGHCLEVWAVEFDPIDELDILNAIKSTFDYLIHRDVFVIHILFTGTFLVHTCLWFGVGFLIDNSRGGRIELREHGRHGVRTDVTGGNSEEDEVCAEPAGGSTQSMTLRGDNSSKAEGASAGAVEVEAFGTCEHVAKGVDTDS